VIGLRIQRAKQHFHNYQTVLITGTSRVDLEPYQSPLEESRFTDNNWPINVVSYDQIALKQVRMCVSEH